MPIGSVSNVADICNVVTDSYGSVNAAKEDKKAKFEYPLLEKEQMKKLLLQSDRVVFQNSSGFFHNEVRVIHSL